MKKIVSTFALLLAGAFSLGAEAKPSGHVEADRAWQDITTAAAPLHWESYPSREEKLAAQEQHDTDLLRLARVFFTAYPADPRRWAAAQLIKETSNQPLNFTGTALDGRKIDLVALRGRIVLIDFWATWCEPCRAAMPRLGELYAAYHPRGLEVIGVSLDQRSALARLPAFCRKNGLIWPQYADGRGWASSLAVAVGIKAIPATLILDRDGRIVSEAAIESDELEMKLQALLGR